MQKIKKNESNYTMKILCINEDKEFISIKLRVFYEKKDIALKYVIFYIYEENKLAERGWQIIITMKDLLFLNSRLLLDF